MVTLIISLYKYSNKEVPVLPTPHTCGDSSLYLKDIEYANKEVKCTLGESYNKKAVTPCDKYNSYTPKEREQIGKDAAENGCTSLKLLD